jgi:hypothetical protein
MMSPALGRTSIRQSMQAILSLMQLIARLATGVSAKRRRLVALGLGSAFCTPVIRNGAKIELIPSGVTVVFRSPTSFPAAFTPATRSHILLTDAAKPIPTSSSNKKAQPFGHAYLHII